MHRRVDEVSRRGSLEAGVKLCPCKLSLTRANGPLAFLLQDAQGFPIISRGLPPIFSPGIERPEISEHGDAAGVIAIENLQHHLICRQHHHLGASQIAPFLIKRSEIAVCGRDIEMILAEDRSIDGQSLLEQFLGVAKALLVLEQRRHIVERGGELDPFARKPAQNRDGVFIGLDGVGRAPRKLIDYAKVPVKDGGLRLSAGGPGQ